MLHSRSPSPYNNVTPGSVPRYGLRRTTGKKERGYRTSDYRSGKKVGCLTDHYDGLTGSSSYISDQRPENEYEEQMRGSELVVDYGRERKLSGNLGRSRLEGSLDRDRRNVRRSHDNYIFQNDEATIPPPQKRTPTNWWKHGKKVERGERRREEWSRRNESPMDMRAGRDKGKGRETEEREEDSLRGAPQNSHHSDEERRYSAENQLGDPSYTLDQSHIDASCGIGTSYGVDIPGLPQIGTLQENFQDFSLNHTGRSLRPSTSRHSLDADIHIETSTHRPSRREIDNFKFSAYDVPGLSAPEIFSEEVDPSNYLGKHFENSNDDLSNSIPANPYAYEDQSTMFQNHLRATGQAAGRPPRRNISNTDDDRRKGRRKSDRTDRGFNQGLPEPQGSAWDGVDAPQNTRTGIKGRRKPKHHGFHNWPERAPQRIPDFILELPPNAVSTVIGKGGHNVQTLMKETGTFCHVDSDRPDGPALMVWGREINLDRVRELANELIKVACPNWGSTVHPNSWNSHSYQPHSHQSQSRPERNTRDDGRMGAEDSRGVVNSHSLSELNESEEYGPLLSMDQWNSLDSWRRNAAQSFEHTQATEDEVQYLASEFPRQKNEQRDEDEAPVQHEASSLRRQSSPTSSDHRVREGTSMTQVAYQNKSIADHDLMHDKQLSLTGDITQRKLVKGLRRVSRKQPDPLPIVPVESLDQNISQDYVPPPQTPPLPLSQTPPPPQIPPLLISQTPPLRMTQTPPLPTQESGATRSSPDLTPRPPPTICTTPSKPSLHHAQKESTPVTTLDEGDSSMIVENEAGESSFAKGIIRRDRVTTDRSLERTRILCSNSVASIYEAEQSKVNDRQISFTGLVSARKILPVEEQCLPESRYRERTSAKVCTDEPTTTISDPEEMGRHGKDEGQGFNREGSLVDVEMSHGVDGDIDMSASAASPGNGLPTPELDEDRGEEEDMEIENSLRISRQRPDTPTAMGHAVATAPQLQPLYPRTPPDIPSPDRNKDGIQLFFPSKTSNRRELTPSSLSPVFLERSNSVADISPADTRQIADSSQSSPKTLFPIFTNDRGLPFHPSTPPTTISESTSDKVIRELTPLAEDGHDPRQLSITTFFHPCKAVSEQSSTDTPMNIAPRSPSPRSRYEERKRKFFEETESDVELDLIQMERERSIINPKPYPSQSLLPTALLSELEMFVIKSEPIDEFAHIPIHGKSSLHVTPDSDIQIPLQEQATAMQSAVTRPRRRSKRQRMGT